jgi:hypothetical protein
MGGSRASCRPILELGRLGIWSGSREPRVRLSKIDDYLADKLCFPMLSEVMGWFQGEIELAVDPVPNLGISGRPRLKAPAFAKERDRLGHPRGKGWPSVGAREEDAEAVIARTSPRPRSFVSVFDAGDYV